jgi:hypothetical protein
MSNPPSLSPEQRQQALEKAAAARRVRAEVKEKLKIGSLSLGELFAQADRGDETADMLSKLKVVAVVESLPGVGKVNARRLMKALKVAESRRIGGLGRKQREGLLDAQDPEVRRRLIAEQREADEGEQPRRSA